MKTSHQPRLFHLSLVSLALWGLLACGSEEQVPVEGLGQADSGGSGVADSTVEIPMVNYVYDPQAGDKAVAAEDGGPGFTGEGWDTNLTFPAVGSPDAVPGGSMRRYMVDWPATLRQHGKDWNTSINYMVRDLCYETLLGVHSTTLEYIPRLATHWKISGDKTTYT